MKLKLNQNRWVVAAITGVIGIQTIVAHGQSANAKSNAPTQLPEMIVKGQSGTTRLDARTNAVTAMKSDVPLLETPQAVSVVPRTVLDDQGAHKLDDVLKNVAGVNYGNCYSEWDGYRIRGFDVSLNNTYVDGLLGISSTAEEIWGVERAEVIKGPASSLYGQGPAGGLLNLITKRPQPADFNEVRLTAGSFNFYEAAFDVNESLNEDGTLYGRLNALYRQNDSFVDYAGSERIYIAPSLTWEITPNTKLTLLTSVKDDQIDMAFPLPARGTVLPNPNGEISIHRYIGNPAYGNDEWERDTRLGYEFSQRFNEHLSLRNNFRYERIDWTSDDLSYPDSLEADQRTLDIYGYRADGFYEGYRVDTALNAQFETGPVEHTLTGGVDYRWTGQDYSYQNSDLVTLDVFAPDYASMPAYQYGPWTRYKSSNDDVGIYVQEHARVWERFTLTLGARYDWSASGDNSDEGFSPHVGLTYEFLPGFSAYASYARSFEPQWDFVDASGNTISPGTGENFELGLKAATADGRFSGLLAVYQLTKTHAATPDLSNPTSFLSIVRDQRSRGVELEGTYKPAPGWEFIGAYSYIDAKVIPEGVRLQGVSENSFSAWLKYTFQDGLLRGFGLGVGGRYYSEQQGDVTYVNPFELPSYAVMDAAVYYQRGRFKGQVNINNVLDERYFVGAYNDVYVLPGEPLNVRASVSWMF